MYHQQQQQQSSTQQQRQSQQRSEWSTSSQQTQTPWRAGHHHHSNSYLTSQRGGGTASHIHRPGPPPPVHFPHQQHRQMHAAVGYYRHGSTASPAAATTRQMSHARSAQPALVSPSTHQATSGANAAASPMTPQSAVVTSLPHEVLPATTTPVAPTNVTPVSAKSPAEINVAAASANMVTTKPPRPYTEYTMFYQLEREYILHRVLTNDDDKAKNATSTDGTNIQPALFQNDPLMPERYRSLPLRADWYISGKSKKPTKRKHRKSHGE